MASLCFDPSQWHALPYGYHHFVAKKKRKQPGIPATCSSLNSHGHNERVIVHVLQLARLVAMRLFSIFRDSFQFDMGSMHECNLLFSLCFTIFSPHAFFGFSEKISSSLVDIDVNGEPCNSHLLLVLDSPFSSS